jgi:hypothetical protein
LASLFWRICRATAIETTLLGIQRMARNHCRLPGVFGSWGARAFDHGKTTDTNGSDDDPDLRPFDRSD